MPKHNKKSRNEQLAEDIRKAQATDDPDRAILPIIRKTAAKRKEGSKGPGPQGPTGPTREKIKPLKKGELAKLLNKKPPKQGRVVDAPKVRPKASKARILKAALSGVVSGLGPKRPKPVKRRIKRK